MGKETTPGQRADTERVYTGPFPFESLSEEIVPMRRKSAGRKADAVEINAIVEFSICCWVR